MLAPSMLGGVGVGERVANEWFVGAVLESVGKRWLGRKEGEKKGEEREAEEGEQWKKASAGGGRQARTHTRRVTRVVATDWEKSCVGEPW